MFILAQVALAVFVNQAFAVQPGSGECARVLSEEFPSLRNDVRMGPEVTKEQILKQILGAVANEERPSVRFDSEKIHSDVPGLIEGLDGDLSLLPAAIQSLPEGAVLVFNFDRRFPLRQMIERQQLSMLLAAASLARPSKLTVITTMDIDLAKLLTADLSQKAVLDRITLINLDDF